MKKFNLAALPLAVKAVLDSSLIDYSTSIYFIEGFAPQSHHIGLSEDYKYDRMAGLRNNNDFDNCYNRLYHKT